MPDAARLLGFALASAVLMLVPGPNVALIVATSMRHGVRQGLLTVCGTASAMVVQLALVALGLAGLLGAGLAVGRGKGFFFEKKKQKTSIRLRRTVRQAARLTDKSFFGSFLQKRTASLLNTPACKATAKPAWTSRPATP